MNRKLPKLNFSVPLTSTDFDAQDEVYEKEFILRFFAMYGGLILNSTPSYGIVAATNPAAVISTTVPSFPLMLFANADLSVDANPGFAVTKSGMIVELPEKLSQLKLASITPGVTNIIFLRYATQDSTVTRLNRYNENLPVSTVYSPVQVQVMRVTDYINDFTFSPEQRDDTVILGYATPTKDQITGAVSLVLDLSQTSYPENRPWFSPVDIWHRSRVGSGAVTETNPHGLSFNDLSIGGLTLYQQLLNHGMILSKDSVVPNVPGSRICYDIIDESRVRIDSSGSVTRESRFGGAGARYARLSAFPCQVGSAYHRTIPANRVAFDWIPQTNIVVIPDTEVIPSLGAAIEYTEAQSLAPYPDPATNTILFKQVLRDNEISISQGIDISYVSALAYTFDGYGPFARKYSVYSTSSGNFLAAPQIVFAATKLDELGTVIRQVPQTVASPAKLAVGLTGASNNASLQVTVRLVGLDATGASLSEDVNFTSLTWSDNIPPVDREEPRQFLKTLGTFSYLYTIQVTKRIGDGTSSVLAVWAELDAQTSPAMQDPLPLTSVFWDGISLTNVRDIRPISHKLTAPLAREPSALQISAEYNLCSLALLKTLNSAVPFTHSSYLLLSEDFRRPTRWDWTSMNSVASNANAVIIVLDPTRFNNNDSITINAGKTLIAKTTGAQQSNGEFNYAGLTISQVRDNIVAAINNNTFNSGRIATADLSDRGRIALVSLTQGAAGNFVVTASVTNVDACAYESFTGGLDGLAQSVIPRNVNAGLILAASEIPDPAKYDVMAYSSHYRSVAIPLASTVNRRKFLVMLTGLSNVSQTPQVRIRGGQNGVWGSWVVMPMSSNPTSHFYYAFSSDQHKLQIAVWATCVGVALYSVSPE